MHNFYQNFNNIMIIVKQSLKHLCDDNGNIPKIARKPKFSDTEVIALSLLAECYMIDSENYLFKKLNKLKTKMPHLVDRSNFNRRRKQLSNYTELVRRSLVKNLTFGEDTFVIDSMPLPICRFSRAKPVDNSHQIPETVHPGDIGDIGTPDLIDMSNRNIPQ